MSVTWQMLDLERHPCRVQHSEARNSSNEKLTADCRIEVFIISGGQWIKQLDFDEVLLFSCACSLNFRLHLRIRLIISPALEAAAALPQALSVTLWLAGVKVQRKNTANSGCWKWGLQSPWEEGHISCLEDEISKEREPRCSSFQSPQP